MSFQDFFKNSVWEDFLSRQAVTSSTLTSMIISLLAALALGLFIYVIYRRFFGGVVFSRSFATTLVGMCVLTCMVTLAISTNVVISLGMVGALSIVRYRTAVKDPMDFLGHHRRHHCGSEPLCARCHLERRDGSRGVGALRASAVWVHLPHGGSLRGAARR